VGAGRRMRGWRGGSGTGRTRGGMRGTGGWVSKRLVSGRDLDGKAMQDEKEMEDWMSVVWSDQMCTHREREKVVEVTSRVMAFPPEEHHLGPIRLDGGHGDGGVS
jgi:hypothetical protein